MIPLLEEDGFEVWGVSRTGGSGGRNLAVDITDSKAIQDAVSRVQPSHVIHLAGTPNLPDSERETAYRVNVDGTGNLLKACRTLRERPARILLASSGYVYGETGPEPADEGRAPAPENEYGRSKLEMEKMAATWHASLPIVIARPFNYTGIGHGERFLVPKLLRVFRSKGDDVSFVDPSVERDFSDVRWLARIYLDLLAVPLVGAACNVCTGVATRLSDLLPVVERISGHRPAKLPPPAQSDRRHRLVGSPARLCATIDRIAPPPFEATLAWMYRGA